MENIKLYENGGILYFPVVINGISGDMSMPSVRWTMYPIAVWDYVDPDYSDIQYWVQQSVPGTGLYPNETFGEIQFILDESAQDVFAEAGYTLKDVSEIYFKDYYNDPDARASKISVEDAINNALDVL